MADINIRVDVPEKMKDKFETALAKALNQFLRRTKFSMLDEIMSKSELTEKEVKDLSDELKEKVAKKHRP